MLISSKDSDAIRQLFTGPQAIAAGIVYLENEVFEFQTRPGSRVWSLYGSPVCLHRTNLVMNTSFYSRNYIFSGLSTSVDGHLATNQGWKRKVGFIPDTCLA